MSTVKKQIIVGICVSVFLFVLAHTLLFMAFPLANLGSTLANETHGFALCYSGFKP